MQPQHNLQDVGGYLFETASEKVTAAIATGAIISPIWLPYAHDIAAQWAPVLGCVWLVLQITLKLIDRVAGIRHKDEEETP
jgi:hypothetical protein